MDRIGRHRNRFVYFLGSYPAVTASPLTLPAVASRAYFKLASIARLAILREPWCGRSFSRWEKLAKLRNFV
jgi:hypothetical protein